MTDDISAWGEAPDPDGEDTSDTFDLGGYDAGDQMPDPDGDDGFGAADEFGPDDGTGGDGTGEGTIAATFEEPLDDASDSAPSDEDLAEAQGAAGLGPADDPTAEDPTAEDTTVRDAESTVGADPDAEPYAEGAWPAPEFPAALDLVPPVPVDGYPWADPATLGDVQALGDVEAVGDADPPDLTALSADLAAYAGSAGTDWAGLAASDDPATAALARFWAPPGS